MKVRIKGNSIRFRLSMTEVESFGRDNYIEETTDFGNGERLVCTLQSSPGQNSLSASFTGHNLTLFLPETLRKEWISTNTVGFSGHMDIGNGKQLALLVEKDWVCLDNTMDEDQSDNFPNPNAACQT